MDLVKLKDGEPKTDSNLVAKRFGIAHNDLLKKIDGFIGEIFPVKFSEMYEKSTRTVRGRDFPVYYMTRDGYMFLVMNISTKRAHEAKLAFISAFNEMERALLRQEVNKNSEQWLTARKQGISARKSETDIIKQFVDYATEQGSQSASKYYIHFTKATYKALHMIQHNKPKLRETLDAMQLAQLMVAENVAQKAITKYMSEGEHYKTIYQLVKQDIETFADTLFLSKAS